MERITPTIGRIVLAFADVGDKFQSFPAIITKVHPDPLESRISAKVFLDPDSCHGAEFMNLPNCALLEPGEGDPGVDGWYCEWMPYQKGQAALTEAIAKKAGINA